VSRGRLLAVAFATTLAVSSCGSGSRDPGRSGEEIVVFAAASLTEAFPDVAAAFGRENKRVRVSFNFGPSDGLATGIENGAPADIFASASPRWMDRVATTPGVIDRAVFARNRLAVIVPVENAARIGELSDLARPGVKLVLAAPAAPAGQYAREMLAAAGLGGAERNVVSNEEDVKGVVQKVILGEADAGVVYGTDVTPAVAPTVRTIPIPDAINVIASYPIAVVRGSRHEEIARAFVAFVLGEGQRILQEAGFLAAS
jgi:molybdate transport system substrate-binding protein